MYAIGNPAAARMLGIRVDRVRLVAFGGAGSPNGAILGATTIGIIDDVIVLFGVPPYWQGIVSGAIPFDVASRCWLHRDAA